VHRALADEEFRTALLTNPEKAIQEAGYELTAEQIEALKGLQVEDFATLSPEELEERLSKAACASGGIFW
jgi:hypothetical protein